jgi:hypothetical protein
LSDDLEEDVGLLAVRHAWQRGGVEHQRQIAEVVWRYRE